jgi:hypothetical protein
VVVTVGDAVTVALVVLLKPTAGDQVYVVAPDAVKVDEAPLHIDGEELLMVTTGGVVNVTVTGVRLLLLQPVAASLDSA